MLNRYRNIQKKDEVRRKIIGAAQDIISKDGIHGLSIRKIANAIGYSPAIIYHYFKNKNDIIDTIVSERIKLIQSTINRAKVFPDEPEKEIKEMFIKYIKFTLSIPEEYKAFILNDDPSIVSKTAILSKGITEINKLMGLLANQIKKGIEIGRFADVEPELTAQIIWTSIFGLIIKLIVEKDIPQDHVDRLIEHNFRILFKGIMKRKEE